jgi:AcrR family transcriptional regulator
MTTSALTPPGPDPAPPRAGGRRRDHSRDPVILQATLDLLCEAGYDGMTLDTVAARAQAGKATLYRRWPTKQQLVLAAIASLGRPFDQDELPDTGQLRSDLIAVIDSPWLGGAARRVEILAGLASVLTGSSELAHAIHVQITEPYIDGYRLLLRRAVQRREVSSDIDVETVAQIIPAMSVYRMMFAKLPPDRDFLESVIDRVVLPALGVSLGAAGNDGLDKGAIHGAH